MTLVVAVASCGILAGAAHADDAPPSPVDSAVVQYTEVVPTAQGPKAPGVGKKTQRPLPPKAKRAIDKASKEGKASKETASTLTVIATSSDYGAPAAAPVKPKPKQNQESTPKPSDVPSPARSPSLEHTLQATAAAAAPVDDAHVLGLLVALAAITFGGGALAVRRHRV